MYKPLADKIRPSGFEEIVGQEHILGENGLLRRMSDSGNITNMIFYGPPGTGKTTAAGIIASKAGRKLYRLNATTASLSDIKQITEELNTFEGINGVLLYLDEIQYFNKKQQQSLLEFIEDGRIVLIASTTENPYFYVYGAILSRSTIFEFKPLSTSDIKKAVCRAFEIWEKENGKTLEIESGVIEHIASCCGGDVRKSINTAELLANTAFIAEGGILKITLSDAQNAAQHSSVRYDRDGDSHFDVLSAFHKSLRGSDPDAAVYYLARALLSGDIPSICRRLLACSSEDVGMAYPQAVSIVKSCVDSALQLGMPEARLPLAQAAILIATAPKSNSVVMAIDKAMDMVQNGEFSDIPAHLKDAHYTGAKKLGRGIEYKYPHNYPNNWVCQQYLPDRLKDKTFYTYGKNKFETLNSEYWEKVRKNQTQSF